MSRWVVSLVAVASMSCARSGQESVAVAPVAAAPAAGVAAQVAPESGWTVTCNNPEAVAQVSVKPATRSDELLVARHGGNDPVTSIVATRPNGAPVDTLRTWIDGGEPGSWSSRVRGPWDPVMYEHQQPEQRALMPRIFSEDRTRRVVVIAGLTVCEAAGPYPTEGRLVVDLELPDDAAPWGTPYLYLHEGEWHCAGDEARCDRFQHACWISGGLASGTDERTTCRTGGLATRQARRRAVGDETARESFRQGQREWEHRRIGLAAHHLEQSAQARPTFGALSLLAAAQRRLGDRWATAHALERAAAHAPDRAAFDGVVGLLATFQVTGGEGTVLVDGVEVKPGKEHVIVAGPHELTLLQDGEVHTRELQVHGAHAVTLHTPQLTLRQDPAPDLARKLRGPRTGKDPALPPEWSKDPYLEVLELVALQ